MAARVRKKGCAKYTIVRPLFVRVRDCVCPLWFSLARDSGGSGGNGVDGIGEIEIGQRMEKEVGGREDENKSKKEERPLFLATESSDRHRLPSALTAFNIAFLEPSYALLYQVYWA